MVTRVPQDEWRDGGHVTMFAKYKRRVRSVTRTRVILTGSIRPIKVYLHFFSPCLNDLYFVNFADVCQIFVTV